MSAYVHEIDATGSSPRPIGVTGAAVDTVVVEDLRTGERRALTTDGVFVFTGMQPDLDGLEGLDHDAWGYVRTDADTRTNIDGVYAAGDVVSKRHRQMTTAVNDGTIAVMAPSKETAA